MKQNCNKFVLRTIPACFLIAAGVALAPQVEAAPKRYDYAEEVNTTLREMRDNVDDMKHELSNHESEIRMFEEKLGNHGTTLDALRQQILDTTQANKELFKSNTSHQEVKLSSLETTTKGLVADFKQLKTHANEVSTSIEQYDQRLTRLEKALDIQSKNIANLETALSSMMGALDVKETSIPKPSASPSKIVATSSKCYRVRPGDSLGKIASDHKTTIRVLKELNHLTQDRIFVGQKLELP